MRSVHPPIPQAQLQELLSWRPASLSPLARICHRKSDWSIYRAFSSPLSSCNLFITRTFCSDYSEIFYFAVGWCWNTGKNNLYCKWFSEFSLESVTRPLEGIGTEMSFPKASYLAGSTARDIPQPGFLYSVWPSSAAGRACCIPSAVLCCVVQKHSFQWLFHLGSLGVTFKFSSVWESVLGLQARRLLAGYRVPGQRQHFEGAAPPAALCSGLLRRCACPRLLGGLALGPQESKFHWNWSGGGSFFIYSDLAGAQAFILNSSAFSSGKFYPTVFLLSWYLLSSWNFCYMLLVFQLILPCLLMFLFYFSHLVFGCFYFFF